MNKKDMMKYFILFFFIFLIFVILVQVGLVMADPMSVEPVIVRAIEYNPGARIYTFNCTIPPDAEPSYHWSVRAGSVLDTEFTSPLNTFTHTLNQDVMYHVGCGVFNSTGDWLTYDIHIDRRTGPYTDRPNIDILYTNVTNITASCEPNATATNYNLYWYFNHGSTHIQLSEFTNQNLINTNAPSVGVWELACGVWDIDNLQWSQSAVTMEFFTEGAAYVPNIDGCMPWGACPLIINGTSEINATLTVTKFVINNDGGILGVGDFPLFVGGVSVISGVANEFVPATYVVSETSHPNYTATISGDCAPDGTITLLPGDIKACTITNDDIGNSPPEAPVWLEPGLNNTNVDTFDFHINVFPMIDADGDINIATDFEMWDVLLNERVWSSLYTNILTHIHNADGVFENNLSGSDRLLYDREYKLRARFYTDSTTNNVSAWSEWRHFRTKEQLTFDNSPFLWTARPGYTVELVASDISVPVNLAMAPNLYGHLPEAQQPLLYVTQLYGQVGVILKDGTYQEYATGLLNYESFGSIPGSGEAGVVGIYVDPTTGDLFVSMVYDDGTSNLLGKVDHFTTNSSGTGYTNQTTILTGIPSGFSHQVHTITRGPDGKLYLNVGDAHDVFQAQNISVLSGKVLRFNDDGSIPVDNPFPDSYVYAAGFRNPFGSAWRPGTNELFVTNNGPDSDDGVYKVMPGDIFGWCCDTAAGTWHHWQQTVAPVQIAFDPGLENFSDLETHDGNISNGTFYVAISGPTYTQGPTPNAKRIVQFKFNPDGTKESVEDLITYTGQGFGTPIGLAFGDDGLYFTDIFGEQGFVGFGVTNGNIYKVIRGNQTANETNMTEVFSAAMSIAPWYPQGLHVVWECKDFGESSGSFTYDYFFGDGHKQLNYPFGNVYHIYPANGTYEASCIIHDLITGLDANASTTLVLGNGGGTFCGDGIVQSPNDQGIGGPLNDGFEECDGSDGVLPGFTCNENCVLVPDVPPICGDGVVNQPIEECDGTDGVGEHQICSDTCTLIDLTFCGDGIVQSPNDEGTGGPLNDGFEECDGTDGVSPGFICTGACTLEELPPPGETLVNLTIAPWFPQGMNYVFICDATGFIPISYDWFFGDGQKQLNSPHGDVWHTYTLPGDYTVMCIATDGIVTESDTLNIIVI